MEEELLQIEEIPRRFRWVRRAVGRGVVLERCVERGGDDKESDRPEHRRDELDHQKMRPDHRGVLDALVDAHHRVLAHEGEQPKALFLSRKWLGPARRGHLLKRPGDAAVLPDPPEVDGDQEADEER